MTSSRRSRSGGAAARRPMHGRTSGSAVLLAVATSAAVVYAAAIGAFTTAVAAAGVGAACAIAAVSFRQSHTRRPAPGLAPLTIGATARVVIAAPTASDVAAATGRHIDAA